jgi:hypothetical protein
LTGARGPTGPPGTAGTQAAAVPAAENTNSVTYTGLTTPGPAVTVTIPAGASKALVSVTSGVTGSNGSIQCYMSFAVSGASTQAASDSRAQALTGVSGTNFLQTSASFVVTGLTPGSNTFTAQYRASVNNQTCTFSNRSIWVIPLP